MKKELFNLSDFEVLVPFNGFHFSGYQDDNLLIKYKNIYFMDNHRLALWCWLQEIKKDDNINIVHIDRHHDLLYSRIDEWQKKIGSKENLYNLSLDHYRMMEINGFSKPTKLFRYDNYLSIFLRYFLNQIESSYFSVYEFNDVVLRDIKISGELKKVFFQNSWRLIDFFNSSFKREENWIINIDLDYFFEFDKNLNCFLFYSIHFFKKLLKLILENSSNFAVITIALSPECCASNIHGADTNIIEGWQNSLKLVKYIFKILNLPYDQVFFQEKISIESHEKHK